MPLKKYSLPIGKSKIITKGRDLTIVTMSNSRHEVMGLKDFFIKNKISPEVIDLLSISPLDMKTITQSVKKTGKLIVIDTCHKSFSTGKEIISNISEENLNYFKVKPILLEHKYTYTHWFFFDQKLLPIKESNCSKYL